MILLKNSFGLNVMMSAGSQIEDVLCEVDAPSTVGTGKFYCFSRKTMESVEQILK